MMLPSKNRIKDNKRIEEVKKKGKLYQSENFGVAVLKKDWPDEPKFAFVISTRISKLAVQRNRINRAFQEGVRRVVPKLKRDLDFVVLAKKNLSGLSTDTIIKETAGFFEKFKP